MASNEKNFKVKLGVTTPKVDYTLDDKVITAEMLDLTTPTLSYSGSAGQLFSISDDLTGTIFSVNDISGIPSIEVNADGTVSLAEFDGNVGIGTATPTQKLDVAGAIRTNDGIYASGDLILGANDTAVAYVKTTGELGIGTDAPTSTLDVDGTARIRTVSNATGDFATVSATGVIQKRTAAETLSDIGAASSSSLSNYLPLTGGTLSGNLTFSDDGEGVFFSGGASVYKRVGTGLILRRHSADTDPQVESNDQSTRWTIWHAGNLTPVTTTTNFGGDVSGTYNSIVVADDSHNHIISNVDGLQTALDGKVDENAAITAGTATKITYDAKGLVTAGASLASGDIPNLDASKITTGTLAVDRGGTGIASYTTGNFIYASGATTLAQRTPAQVLSDIGAAASSHTHGNITNAGAIGSTADLVVTTTTSGVLTTSSRSGIDSRSTFPPSSHTHPVSEVSDSTTVGQNLVKLTNPSAIRFLRVNADNTVSALDASTFRTAIGAGTSSTVGTVTSVGGTGTVAGITLSGTVTSSGNLTLGGTLSTPVSTISDSTTVGQNLVKLTNPSAIRFIRINADNTVSALDASTFRSAIGAGTGSGTVTSVAAGNGLDFTTITGSGSVTLGTPGTITGATTNSVTATSHTHALTLAALTAGTGLTSTGTFDGSTARTFSIDSTVATLTGSQALTNKTYEGLSVSTGTNTFTLTRGTATLVRSGAHAMTLTTTGATNVTFPTSGTLATTAQLPTVNNATLTMNVSGTGLSGSQTFTANQSSAATFTVTSNATSANTASTIVARDASGNFTAGTITAALSGNATTATTASATTAAVTFNNGGAGEASGTTFNGSTARTISYNTIGAAASSHSHSAADITSGTLAVARGGTGIASYTTGNYIYASGTTTLAQRTPAQILSDIIPDVAEDFPGVLSVSSQSFNTPATSHNVDLPATINQGDLLIVLFSTKGSSSTVDPSGWNRLLLSSSPTLGIWYRFADGTEGGTDFVYSNNASVIGASQVYRIDKNYAAVPELATSVTGTSTTPDAPSVTASWGSAKNLFIGVVSQENGDTDGTISPPANYTNLTSTLADDGGTAIMRLHSFRRSLEAATDNPGTITISSALWRATTLVIRPLQTLSGVARETVKIIAGTGMTGGGDLSQNVTLSVDTSGLVDISSTQTVTGTKRFDNATGTWISAGDGKDRILLTGGAAGTNTYYVRLRPPTAGLTTNRSAYFPDANGDILLSSTGVTLDTSQTITGIKTFSESIRIDETAIDKISLQQDGFYGSIRVSSLTGSRSWNFPDEGGTVALTTTVVTLAGTQTVDGAKTFTTTQTLNNNTQLRGKETGGTGRNIAYIDSINRVGLGDTAIPTIIQSSITPTYHNGTNTYDIYHAGNLPAATATGGGSDKVFWENDTTVTTNYTITTGKNAMSAGPITVNNGVTVTVPNGSTWTVV